MPPELAPGHETRAGAQAVPFGFWSSPVRNSDAPILEQLLSEVVCTVGSGGWYSFPRGWSMPARVVPNVVVFICVDGQLGVEIGGEPVSVGAGEVVLAPAGMRQRVSNSGISPVSFYTVHLEARLYGVLDMPGVYRLAMWLRPSNDGLDEMMVAAHRIVDGLSSQRPGRALSANGDGARLVAAIWRETVATRDGQSPVAAATARDLARLAPVFQLIQQYAAEPLNLRRMAATVHLEPTYFSSIFKRVTGMPPHRYLAAYRLQQVRNRLISTQDPIRKIALATGYTDAFYLSRVFRRAEGMSPSAYRTSHDRPALP